MLGRSNAPCQCSQLPEIVRLDDYPSIRRDSDELESGDWLQLVCCRTCGQLWSVDEWDKYQRQFAIKIPRREGWREFDTMPLHREFLVRSHGGLMDEQCIWAASRVRRCAASGSCGWALDRYAAKRELGMGSDVWYVKYGSNLSEQHFLCYIQGGTPCFGKKHNISFTDKTLPKDNRPITIHYSLYFALPRSNKETTNWGHGGVTFISLHKEVKP